MNAAASSPEAAAAKVYADTSSPNSRAETCSERMSMGASGIIRTKSRMWQNCTAVSTSSSSHSRRVNTFDLMRRPAILLRFRIYVQRFSYVAHRGDPSPARLGSHLPQKTLGEVGRHPG